MVERNLAKVEVAGSNPVSRSGLLEWWNGRHAGLKILWALARAGSSPASSTKNQIECVGILDVLKVEMVLDENQFKLFYFQAEEISKMLFAMIKT